MSDYDTLFPKRRTVSNDLYERTELEKIPAIPRPALYKMIESTELERDRAIMSGYFLMANRASEGLAIKPSDVQLQMGIDVFDEELKQISDELNRLRIDVDAAKLLGGEVEPLVDQYRELYGRYREMRELRRKYDVPGRAAEATDEIASRWPQTKVYVVRLLTLKRATKIPRSIPIPVLDPLAPLFSRLLEGMNGLMINLTRQRIWQIFDKVGVYNFYSDQGYPVPKNPLRHARLSEVNNVFNGNQLDRYAGWKIKGTKDHYIHMKWDDYVAPLVKVAKRAPPFEVTG